MPLVPVIGGYANVPAGGGTSAPGLPVWMFDNAVTPDDGCFVALDGFGNPTTPDQVVTLGFSQHDMSGVYMPGLFGGQPYSSLIVLTSLTTGKSYVYSATSGWQIGATVVTGSVGYQGSDATPFAGLFAVSMAGIRTDSTALQITAVLGSSGITPVADGTYTIAGPNSDGSITFSKGICTAFSPNA